MKDDGDGAVKFIRRHTKHLDRAAWMIDVIIEGVTFSDTARDIYINAYA